MLEYVVKQVSILKEWLKNTCQLLKMVILNTDFGPFTYSHEISSVAFVNSLQDEHQKRMDFWKEMAEFDFQCSLLFEKLSCFHEQFTGAKVPEHTKFILFSIKLSFAIDGNLMKCEELLQKLQKMKAFGYQAVPGTPIFRNVFFDILCYRQELMNAAQKMEFLWKEIYEQEEVLLKTEKCIQSGYQDFSSKNGTLRERCHQKCSESLSCHNPNFQHKQPKTAEHAYSQKTYSPYNVVTNTTNKTVLSESVSSRFYLDKYLEPIKVESYSMEDLNHKNLLNPLLRLPLADFTTSSRTRGEKLSLQPLTKVNKLLKDVSIQTQDKEEGEIGLSTSSPSNSKEMQDKYSELSKECGVQTELSFGRASPLELSDSLLTSFSEQTDPDTKSSVFWDSYDLHLSRRMFDNSVNWQQDWDVKEHNELQGIENLLKYTEAILKEEDMALREEQTLESLLREAQLPMYFIFNGDVNKGNYQQNQDIQKNMESNAVTRLNRLSSTPNVNITHQCTSLHSLIQQNNYLPDDSVINLQHCDLDMVEELKELHLTEERISVESKNIKECCELGSHEAFKKDCPFNISNKRLSFLALLRRQRNQVEGGRKPCLQMGKTTMNKIL
ncbi:hypothetical protein XENTR_v10008671 [Xenopus tropicalis]|uniref:Uncharacterized protein germes isoform X1 n=1 Tax=Xenopus tropicalis TaxID=8364 RepID=A0A8J1JAE3_XENTR|nr:uncharacterized protein germes isoform X1 [Xenopus tropicalis]XP_031754842.1 uncharacterized protein germes isoform X1 [Xenopus tropicalis]KAE8615956.1 hypothetical protein XENTR_v10008671 [Xenopus tropicalis]